MISTLTRYKLIEFTVMYTSTLLVLNEYCTQYILAHLVKIALIFSRVNAESISLLLRQRRNDF